MPPVNSMDYSGKDTVLDVIRKESADFFNLVDDPKNWNVQTRCTEWEVRDMVGHMIDVTEGYLTRWEKARKGEPANTVGLLVMSTDLNTHAQAFRSLPREEAITRFKDDYTKMMEIFEKLTAEEWGSFIVTHPFMGPLPTFFYPAFHVMDYGVHTWDIRYGLGEKTRKLDERTAGVLIPYMLYRPAALHRGCPLGQGRGCGIWHRGFRRVGRQVAGHREGRQVRGKTRDRQFRRPAMRSSASTHPTSCSPPSSASPAARPAATTEVIEKVRSTVFYDHGLIRSYGDHDQNPNPGGPPYHLRRLEPRGDH